MSTFMKNGGWFGCGSFLAIRFDGDSGGRRVQITSYTNETNKNGGRSRAYWQLRDGKEVVEMGAAIKSLKAARAFADAHQ